MLHTHEDLSSNKTLSVIFDTPIIPVSLGHKDTRLLKRAAQQATSRFSETDFVTENKDSDRIVFLTSSAPYVHTSIPHNTKRRLLIHENYSELGVSIRR